MTKRTYKIHTERTRKTSNVPELSRKRICVIMQNERRYRWNVRRHCIERKRNDTHMMSPPNTGYLLLLYTAVLPLFLFYVVELDIDRFILVFMFIFIYLYY